MQSSDIKYIGYGIAGIISVAMLTVVGLLFIPSGFTATATNSPIPTSTNTLTPTATVYYAPTLTPTYTFTPTLSNLPSPTSTSTPTITPTLTTTELKIQVGVLTIAGPLTQSQQIRLYDSSQKFIAPTTIESTRIGEQINGVGYGSPTIICGPLSIAILQSAGLVQNETLVPFDFWLLNPFISKDRALINRTFPPDQYLNFDVTTPINELEFPGFSLLPGDFLYIKHGSGGNFDHMLVVNRVDSEGRAYSVTNHNTEQGFVIDEALLFDPNDSNAGIFRKWTARRDAIEGSTGFGGYELWRLRAP